MGGKGGDESFSVRSRLAEISVVEVFGKSARGDVDGRVFF